MSEGRTVVHVDLSPLEAELSRMNSKLSDILSELKDIKRESKSHSKLLDTAVDRLEKLIRVGLELEKLKAQAELQLSERKLKIVQEKLELAINRYRLMYVRIIKDFANDILNGLIHFIQLADEELKPLWDIVKSMQEIIEIFENINPIEEDKELLDFAISLYENRKREASKYLEHEKMLVQKVLEVRKSKEEFVNRLLAKVLPKKLIKGNALVLFKGYIVKVDGKDGPKYYLYLPAKKVENDDITRPILIPLKLSEKLKDKVEKSLKNKKVARPVKIDEKARKEAIKLVKKKTKYDDEGRIVEEAL